MITKKDLLNALAPIKKEVAKIGTDTNGLKKM